MPSHLTRLTSLWPPFGSGSSTPPATGFAEALLASLTTAVPLAGGWWAEEAPEGTPLPYGVLQEGDDDLAQNESNAQRVEPVACMLNGFVEDSRVAARTLMRAISTAAFDPALTLALPYHLIHCRTESQHVELDPERGPGGGDVWRAVVMVQAVVGK